MDKLHYVIKIILATDKSFFGSGVLTLLNLTEKSGSLNAAAKIMNLSYSKANRMIHTAEKSLGFKLLDRKIGGANGGGSSLTPECVEFIDNYEKFCKDIKGDAENLFNKYFSKYVDLV